MKHHKVISKTDVEKLKQLARKLKKHDNIPHHESLDLVSAIIDFDSWDEVVSIHKKSEKQFKIKSIILSYDIKDGIEIDDWRLFPIIEPVEMLIKARRCYLSAEDGLSLSPTQEFMGNDTLIGDQEFLRGFLTFSLNPIIGYMSLSKLSELLHDFSFFYPMFIWINDELSELESISIDVHREYQAHIELFTR